MRASSTRSRSARARTSWPAAALTGTIRLWNVADPAHPQLLGHPLTGSTGPVNSLAFTSKGYTLAEGSSDGTIRLWNLNIKYAITRICAITRTDLTIQLWHANIPQRSFQPPCSA
jgi:WD40 repeat protein